MGPVGLGFGIATGAVVGLNIVTRKLHRDPHALVASGLLAAGWAYSKITIPLFGYEATMALGNAVDAFCGCIVVGLWTMRPATWKWALAGVFGLKLAIHIWFTSRYDLTDYVPYNYVLALNIAFGMALFFGAWPGGGSVASAIGDWVGDHLPRRRWSLPQARRQTSRPQQRQD